VTEIARSIDAIWRIEAPRIIGGLSRLVRDVGLAEELAQDALVLALEQWPERGVPANPGAWLMLAAKRRAIDRFRHNRMARDKAAEVAREIEAREDEALAMVESHLDDDIGDERLALIFAACHPLLGAEAQAALTLRLLGGLTPAEIGRAFLVNEKTIQQRIVRAKKALRDAEAGFEVPHGPARRERLAGVLAVIYLIYNEGYAATSGDDWMRPQLCAEAMRLGRILCGLLPAEGEALGLLALMELQASRFAARASADGSPVLLPDQDRRRWDQLLIRRGLDALRRAETLGQPRGSYRLQAEIAACHARARQPGDTDWARIAALYEALSALAPSPVVALNRAVALAMAFGAEVGLLEVEAIAATGALRDYHLLDSVRGDLLEKLGRRQEAAVRFEAAAALARNGREKALLTARAQSCRQDG